MFYQADYDMYFFMSSFAQAVLRPRTQFPLNSFCIIQVYDEKCNYKNVDIVFIIKKNPADCGG